MSDNWGNEYAIQAENRRIMERMKKRRQRARQASQERQRDVAASMVEASPEYEVFVSRSGVVGVRPKYSAYAISLPYVAFLHRSAA